ncbi:putative photosynthesis system II assembly factor Ycf48/Hcf136-like domain-containing protein [Helianthus annuus]|nr:putative photosynthesis system II assembly factor Ycf48/Hcf136-like domain-containing protein [Helianthus annuus]
MIAHSLVLSLNDCSRTGNRIIGQLQEESKTWVGEQMVDFSCLCVITEEFKEIPLQSRDFGILDVGYRSKEEAWAAEGSGILRKTTNSGKSWSRDKAADNIAANLYSVK